MFIPQRLDQGTLDELFHRQGYFFPCWWTLSCYFQWIGLREIYREIPYLLVKTMVSCRFSLKPIHWYFRVVARVVTKILCLLQHLQMLILVEAFAGERVQTSSIVAFMSPTPWESHSWSESKGWITMNFLRIPSVRISQFDNFAMIHSSYNSVIGSKTLVQKAYQKCFRFPRTISTLLYGGWISGFLNKLSFWFMDSNIFKLCD